jgi:hypothetical protein
MNAFEKITAYVQAHAYRKGQFVGEAPVDRRSKSHFRARVTPAAAYVRFHHTDLLTAYPDGRVVLRCNGWGTAPTTRDAMWAATNEFFHRGVLATRYENGYPNPVISIRGRQFVFYDGMEFNADGVLLSEERPFQAFRADKAARTKWDETAAPFKAVFPMLYAAEPVHSGYLDFTRGEVERRLKTPELWGELAAMIRRAYPNAESWKGAWTKFRLDQVRGLNITINL